MQVTLSKSKFVAGLQCTKRLYLLVRAPELRERIEDAGEATIEQGYQVGLLARQLFPGGVEVDASRGLDYALRTTKQLLCNPEIPAIFESAFEHEGVIVKADILQRRKDNHWRLVEVKSASD